jgi:hypothetical protein
LTPDGILIITRWEFVPPRQALRVVSLGRAAMERMGIANPSGNFLIVQTQDKLRKTAVLMKRTAFTSSEIARAREFVNANKTTIRSVFLPDAPGEDEFSSLLLAPNLLEYAAKYPNDISPVDDSRPFFFHTTRWSNLYALFRYSSEDMKNNLALLLLAVLVVVSGAGVLALLLLPKLFSGGKKLAGASATRWFYFLLLGVGYILAELAFIQTFILFTGHPIYGMTIVVFSLLVGSGLGSRWSGRLSSPDRAARLVPFILAVVLVVTFLGVLPYLLPLAQPFSRAMRALISVVFLTPIGFLMGIPFPAGVRSAAERDGDILPWLWSANAGGSVFGSVLAIILAMKIGLPAAGAIGGLCYLAAAVAARLTVTQAQEAKAGVQPAEATA